MELIVGLAILTLYAAYLTWFIWLLRYRLKTGGLRSRPLAERLRDQRLEVLLLPAVLTLIGFSPSASWAIAEFSPAIALAVWTFAPRKLGSQVIPLALVTGGLYGFLSLRDYVRDNVLIGHYGVVPSGVQAGALYSDYTQFLTLQAYAFLAAGLWLAWRAADKDGPAGRLLRVRSLVPGRPDRPRWGLLLLVVLLLGTELFGRTMWLGITWWTGIETLAVTVVAVVLIARFPGVAADLALAGLFVFGLYGLGLALFWPKSAWLPSQYVVSVRYGAVWVDSQLSAVAAGLQGVALTGLTVWLIPRAADNWTRALFRSASETELATRVVRLTRTRADAVDNATAELRRLERDLHDGPQARLVALGMSLRAAERLIIASPQAAAVLVAEARETSVKVLDELRDLVRGICPPVLADRGLADAVRALALDTPLPTEVEVDFAGRPSLPVETACYFAIAEVLANAVKHAEARHAHVRMWHANGAVRITITDDGVGGADPRRGTGLLGLEQRLGTFDGVLAVNSPPGGPTIIAIEVPCALTGPRQRTAFAS